jgi:hypothetical protein
MFDDRDARLFDDGADQSFAAARDAEVDEIVEL